MKNQNKKQQLIIMTVAFIVLIILPACVVIDRFKSIEITYKQQGTIEPTQANKFAGVEGIDCIPNIDAYEIATLIDVIDGDSIKVAIEGKEYQVRFIGIDTPEFNSDQRLAAIDAANANKRLLSGPLIYLFKDQTNTDRYDRLLRYVITNGRFVNLELVRSGHAISMWYRPDVSCQPLFDSAVPE